MKFFQTIMGKKFFERDVPRIADALVRIAKALEDQPGPPKPKGKREVARCSVCGTSNVSVMCWVNARTNIIECDVEPASSENWYCNACETHVPLVFE